MGEAPQAVDIHRCHGEQHVGEALLYGWIGCVEGSFDVSDMLRCAMKGVALGTLRQ